MYFTPDYYPTPPEVIETMIAGLNLTGKVILEPQAGSGNIVKALQHAGAKEVLACENDPQLVRITQSLCRVIEKDFLDLTSDKISHIDFIIMNPPFSTADAHILHAYKIAPAGCQIISLCNSATLSNDYSKTRKELKTLIETYGQIQELGECFTTAERKTEVEVSLIRLQKPGEYKNEFEGFFMDEDPEESQANGLMSYNAVRDLVNRYVESIKIFDEQLQTAVKLNNMQAGYFSTSELSINVTEKGVPVKRNDFKKAMQRSGWLWIFDKMDLTKHTTRGLREDINKFVEKQQEVPFTMRNIYHMLDMIIQTTGQRMDKALLEVFEKITKHHDDNKYGLPGWKTNSHYLLTRRFIYPYVGNVNAYRYGKSFGATGETSFTIYSHDLESIADLEKALCYITGDNWDEIKKLSDVARDKPYGEWHTSHFLKYKGFKKGTVHFEFVDEDVWARFNQRIAKLRGYPLPEKKSETAYQAKQNGHKAPQTAYRPTAQKPVILSTIEI